MLEEQEVGLAPQRQKPDIEWKGLRHCLCDVGLRPGDIMVLTARLLIVVCVWALVVGWIGWVAFGD